jgi:hypothetical protein
MNKIQHVSGYQKRFGVLARGVSDLGGLVGYADIVIHDSPPLTGCPESNQSEFSRLAISGIPGHTAVYGSKRPSQCTHYADI